MTAVVVGLAVAVGLLGVLVAGLLRSNAELTRALHRLGIDLSPGGAPSGATTAVGLGIRPTPGRPSATDVVDLSGSTPRGDALKLAVTSVAHDTLIAFLTSGCATCHGFWDSFRQRPPEVPGGARLVVVTRGAEAESPGTIASLAGDRLPVVMSTDAWERYDVPYAPYFVYVSGPAGQIVGEGVAAGWEEVRTLVATALTDRRSTSTGSGAERESRIDSELRASGIMPGDPRLHMTTARDSTRNDQ